MHSSDTGICVEMWLQKRLLEHCIGSDETLMNPLSFRKI